MKEHIRLSGVSFKYKKTTFAIKDISLTLFCGQTAVIAGASGSGKTTLSKLMMGILAPLSGSVIMDGQDIKKLGLPETAKRSGYVFQNPERQLFCSSAKDEIKFSLKLKGESEKEAEAKAEGLLARFSMQERARDFPLKLSRGEKQRLALLAVFAMKPPYYILDEPSSGIDEQNKAQLVEMLREIKREGAGLCIITHDKALTESLADRVLTMEGGRVVSDESA